MVMYTRASFLPKREDSTRHIYLLAFPAAEAATALSVDATHDFHGPTNLACAMPTANLPVLNETRAPSSLNIHLV